MYKKILTLLLLFSLSGVSYALNSFWDDIQGYVNQEIKIQYSHGMRPKFISGKLLQIFDDGILLKDGKDKYYINKEYIIRIKIDK